MHTGRTARVAKLTLKPMNLTDNNQNKLHQGYTILPDGTRHEFVIEGWEEYNDGSETDEDLSDEEELIMAYETLIEEARDLPEDTLLEVLDFIVFLKHKNQRNNKQENTIVGRKHRVRSLGRMKDKIKMLDGFDEIPAGFEEYMQ